MKKLLVALIVVSVMVLGACSPGYAAQSPGSWSSVGEVPGPYDTCGLLTVNGLLYAGAIDGNVWSWDGTQWTNLGGLADHDASAGVLTLAMVNGEICAGTSGAGVWVWDGSTWSKVGNLTGNAAVVHSIATVNGTVYAATEDGNVWSWDGAQWTNVDNLSSCDGSNIANCVATVNGEVYAGTVSNGVWAWNGSTWSKVGTLTGNAAGLATVNGTVYAGTDGNVWAWNGTSWTNVGNLSSQDGSNTVDSFITVNGQVYVGTVFDGVWALSGSTWSKVGSITVTVSGLATSNGTLFAGTEGYGVQSWDGSAWSRLSPAGSLGGGAVSSLVTYNDAVYAATADGSGVWTWNGSAWSRVGGSTGLAGSDAFVNSLTTVNGTLYAGTGANDCVQSWNGSAWSPVGTLGTTDPVLSLATVNDTLYAGTNGAGVWAWNGSAWSQVGGPTGLTGYAAYVISLAVLNGILYAGSSDAGVWAWNGSTWSQVGGSTGLTGNAAICRLLAVNGTLYAGTDAGVWVWNGSTWSQVGGPTGLTGNAAICLSLITGNGTLYAGTEAGVWTWNGSAWYQLGNNDTLNAASVYSLVTDDGALYAGVYGAGVWSMPLLTANSPSGSGPANNGGTAGVDTLNPAVGGTVDLGNGVSLTIPAGALQGSSGIPVAVRAASSPPAAPSGFEFLSTIYQFTVNNQDHYDFNGQVTLTFTFDPSKLPPGSTPAVYYYDDTTGKWVAVGGTMSGDTITVAVNHFTDYAVMTQLPSPATPAVQLKDIAGNWAQANIEKLVSLGAVTGYPDGTFRPDKDITRAEFVAVLVKALKLAPRGGPVFPDTQGNWAEAYISTAEAYGIVSGYDSSRFGPNDPITREQMVSMAVRAARLAPLSAVLSFRDAAQVDSWAREYIATAVKNGIANGYPDGTFRPLSHATRAEAVTLIAGLIR